MQYLIGKWILGSAPLEMKYLVDLYLFFHFAFNGFTALLLLFDADSSQLSVLSILRRRSTQRCAATHRNNGSEGFVD